MSDQKMPKFDLKKYKDHRARLMYFHQEKLEVALSKGESLLLNLREMNDLSELLNSSLYGGGRRNNEE